PFNQILKQNAKREMRLRLGKVTVADVLAAQPVTTNLLKFMRASIKMIGVSNLQSFIASMTQKLTLSDISDESKNYLDKAGIRSEERFSRNAETDLVCRLLLEKKKNKRGEIREKHRAVYHAATTNDRAPVKVTLQDRYMQCE